MEAGSFFGVLPNSKGDKAILESPNIKASTKSCTMTFYYHMYGFDIGSLLIYMRSDTSFQLMKNITGQQGDVWHKGNATFVSLSDYRVHIIAVYGSGSEGDIAIDDISFQGCGFNSRKDNSYCRQGNAYATIRLSRDTIPCFFK